MSFVSSLSLRLFNCIDLAVLYSTNSSFQNSSLWKSENRTPIIGSNGYDCPQPQEYSKCTTVPTCPIHCMSNVSSVALITFTISPILNGAPFMSREMGYVEKAFPQLLHTPVLTFIVSSLQLEQNMMLIISSPHSSSRSLAFTAPPTLNSAPLSI